VARLAYHQARACAGLLGRWLRDRDPPAVSEASWLLVLPVAARRWVLTDNTFWHAQWDLIDIIDYFIDYIDYFLRLHRLLPSTISTTIGCIILFSFIDFHCQDVEREPDYF
jgi:hypothetical protein